METHVKEKVGRVNLCLLNHDMKATTGAGRFGRLFVERMREYDPSLVITVLTSVASGYPGERPIVSESGWRMLFALPRIRRAFRGADVIHALDGYPYGVVAVLASLGLGKPIVITAIGTGGVQSLYRWYAPLVVWAYRRAAVLSAVSRNTRDEILRRAPDLDIEVIRHGIDAEEFAHPDQELSPDEHRLIASLRPYIFSVGAWKPRKGFAYSFAAFADLKRQIPAMHYVICGIGPKPQLTESLGITESVVTLKGIRWPLLRALYANAELFMLLPVDDRKDIEGFGLAFLEAAAAGVPVVASRGSGADDAIAEGENALVVPPRDPHAAAAAMRRIIGDPGLRAQLAAGSRRFAARMGWEPVIARYRTLYDTMIRAGARGTV
ncbi:glycosyltransferase [Candidatus Parcubacteria bacterium]|nr:MAG: glycosyltransferase [Candidatus Parcubacteria bacterium]